MRDEIKQLIDYMKKQNEIISNLENEYKGKEDEAKQFEDKESGFYKDAISERNTKLIEYTKIQKETKIEIEKRKEKILDRLEKDKKAIDEYRKEYKDEYTDLSKMHENIKAKREALEGAKAQLNYLKATLPTNIDANKEKISEAEKRVEDLTIEFQESIRIINLVPDGKSPKDAYLEIQDQINDVKSLSMKNIEEIENKYVDHIEESEITADEKDINNEEKETKPVENDTNSNEVKETKPIENNTNSKEEKETKPVEHVTKGKEVKETKSDENIAGTDNKERSENMNRIAEILKNHINKNENTKTEEHDNSVGSLEEEFSIILTPNGYQLSEDGEMIKYDKDAYRYNAEYEEDDSVKESRWENVDNSLNGKLSKEDITYLKENGDLSLAMIMCKQEKAKEILKEYIEKMKDPSRESKLSIKYDFTKDSILKKIASIFDKSGKTLDLDQRDEFRKMSKKSKGFAEIETTFTKLKTKIKNMIEKSKQKRIEGAKDKNTKKENSTEIEESKGSKSNIGDLFKAPTDEQVLKATEIENEFKKSIQVPGEKMDNEEVLFGAIEEEKKQQLISDNYRRYGEYIGVSGKLGGKDFVVLEDRHPIDLDKVQTIVTDNASYEMKEENKDFGMEMEYKEKHEYDDGARSEFRIIGDCASIYMDHETPKGIILTEKAEMNKIYKYPYIVSIKVCDKSSDKFKKIIYRYSSPEAYKNGEKPNTICLDSSDCDFKEFTLKGDSYVDKNSDKKGEDGQPAYETLSYEQIMELAGKRPTQLSERVDQTIRDGFKLSPEIQQIYDKVKAKTLDEPENVQEEVKF